MSFLRKKVDEIRDRSFSDIEGPVWVWEIPFLTVGGMALFIFGKVKLMLITSKYRNLSDSALRGIIAHELCHFSIFQKGGWWGFWKHVFTCGKRGYVAMERRTDRLAIRRGYGKDLVALKEEVGEMLVGTRWGKILDNFLSVDETRSYMKKFS